MAQPAAQSNNNNSAQRVPVCMQNYRFIRPIQECYRQSKNRRHKEGYTRWLDYIFTHDQPITKKGIWNAFNSQKTPTYYHPGPYRTWCQLQGTKDDYYETLYKVGWKKIANSYLKYKQKKESNKKTKKNKKNRIDRSNARKPQKSKQATQTATNITFQDFHPKKVKTFIKWYDKQVNKSHQGLLKNINYAHNDDWDSKISNDFQVLLCFTCIGLWDLAENKGYITKEEARFYGKIFMNNYPASHPIKGRAYHLLGVYDGDSSKYKGFKPWAKLFWIWKDWEKNQIFKSIKAKYEIYRDESKAETSSSEDETISATDDDEDDADDENEDDEDDESSDSFNPDDNVEDEQDTAVDHGEQDDIVEHGQDPDAVVDHGEQHEEDSDAIVEYEEDPDAVGDDNNVQNDKDDIGLDPELQKAFDDCNIKVISIEILVQESVKFAEIELLDDDSIEEYLRDVLKLNPIQRFRLKNYIKQKSESV